MMKKYNIVLLLLSLLLINPLLAKQESESPKLEEQVSEKIESKPFIEVSDISEYSVKTTQNLKSIKEATAKTKEQIEIHDSIPEYVASIETMLNDPQHKTLEILNIRKLQQLQSEFSIYLSSLTAWNQVIKSRIEVYDKNRKLLETETTLWTETETNAAEKNAPEAIQEQIVSINADIKELEKSTKLEYDLALTDLNILTTNIVQIENMISELKKNEVIASNQVFHQNSLPLFESLSDESFSISGYILSLSNTIVERFNESKNYFHTQTNQIYIFMGAVFLILVFVLYFNYLYLRRKLFVKKESSYKKEFYFIKTPVVTVMILLALALVIIFPDRSRSVMQFVLFLLIFPLFRILQTVINRESVKYLYGFLILYSLELLHSNTVSNEVEGRVFSIVLSLGMIAYIFALIRSKVLDSFINKFINSFAYKILTLFILLSIISIASNIYGGVLLSNRINSGIFMTIYSALIFYTLYIVLTGYVIVIFRRRVSSASHMLEKYSKKIENITISTVKVIMFLWWLKIVFEALSIYPYLISFKDEVLALSWTISSTTISVASIVDFIFIIFGTWVIAKVVITVLNVEVFARFSMPRGIPTAITTTLNYIIVISGAVVALSSLGVTPEQFTLVFGALGVGIGFGLRNIIANFVSGIIMVFERPVQIGDTIEVDKTMGSVQSIGARSSTIKTFDGSEVIIPNADFIAKEITNWTLSDEYRRKIVIFKVDFDSDVEEVLSIMKGIAVNHPDVLKDPEPLATFQGFGENYLEFKLYFWLSKNLIVAQSEVSIGIYKALKEAGIKMPIPKQEMFIKNRDEEEIL